MKKLALITLDYPPERGGVARYLGGLVEASDGAFDVYLDKTHQASGPGSVHPVKLLVPGWPAWRPMIGFIRGLGHKGYDTVLLSHVLPVGVAAMLARWLGGLPYAVICHGLDLRLARISWRKRLLARLALRGAKLVLVNSEATAKEVRELDSSLRPKVLTPGLQPGTYPSRGEARQKLGVAAEAKLVVSVCRFVSRKGLDHLIEAVGGMKDVQLVLIGDGHERDRLSALAKPFGERIRFVAEATDTERDAWLAAADLFALPARDEGTDVEGFGIVFLEAAAAGLPCVAGKSGGVGEAIVDGETGLLVDPTDVSSIRHAIQTLLDDPALRERMGTAGRARVLKDFRWEDRWKALKSWL
jgi:phosphatidylinositol alpha-1,6-mannosyltransferase